jgi:adenylate cyclase
VKIRQTNDAFRMLLGRWLATAEPDRPQVEKDILRVFEEPLSIFVLDMSGFSSSVMRHGIIHFLAMIQQMHEVTEPIILAQGGEVVKYIGDDILAVFDDPDEAYEAALEIIRAVAARNHDFPREFRIRVAIGIGFGPTLFVPGVDVWGDQANQAFKLGEDTAGPEEILLTAAAHAALRSGQEDFKRLDLDISGLRIEAYSRHLAATTAD